MSSAFLLLGEVVDHAHNNCRLNCRVQLGLPIVPHPISTSKCRKREPTAAPTEAGKGSVSLSGLIILFSHIILIHPAGKCSGQHLLSLGERVSEITKCTKAISCNFLSYKEKFTVDRGMQTGFPPSYIPTVFLLNTMAGHAYTYSILFFSHLNAYIFLFCWSSASEKKVFKKDDNQDYNPIVRLHASAAVIMGSIPWSGNYDSACHMA